MHRIFRETCAVHRIEYPSPLRDALRLSVEFHRHYSCLIRFQTAPTAHAWTKILRTRSQHSSGTTNRLNEQSSAKHKDGTLTLLLGLTAMPGSAVTRLVARRRPSQTACPFAFQLPSQTASPIALPLDFAAGHCLDSGVPFVVIGGPSLPTGGA